MRWVNMSWFGAQWIEGKTDKLQVCLASGAKVSAASRGPAEVTAQFGKRGVADARA